MSVEVANLNAETGAPVLRRTLSGALAVRFGALPIVPLPGDDEPSIGFVWDVADIIKDKGLYRRDNVIVIVNDGKRRLEEMTPEAFCTWTQRHFMGSKVKYDSNDEPFEVIKDVPTELAIKTLRSHDFIPMVPEIVKVLPVPMPFFSNGEINLASPGYDKTTKTMTYKL